MKLTLLDHNSKIPLAGSSWKAAITDDLSVHESWSRQGFNRGLALKENGYVAADYDEKPAAREAWKRFIPKRLCNLVVETRRGAHFIWKGVSETKKYPWGDWKGNGYLVFPWSTVDGWTYRFLIGDEHTDPLPVPDEFVPSIQPSVTAITRDVHNGMRYVMAVESIQGQGGSRGLVRACAILRDAGLSELDAMAALVRWNMQRDKVSPPWSPEELARAVKNVFRKGQKS